MNEKPHTSTDPPETELLRADRDLTRQELGQTLAELTSKFDLKARAGEQLEHTADTAREKVTGVRTIAQDNAVRVAQVARLRPVPLAVVAVLLAAPAAWFVVRYRRNR
ncbi:DUF3618 domain-containing protein [Nocardia sp. NPDC051321]|uniref:DUF3618 domain-containing protein n=1 Tax=Nocardia sp. NPDC051321 TaxID=3364323 RepID=UPI00379F394E